MDAPLHLWPCNLPDRSIRYHVCTSLICVKNVQQPGWKHGSNSNAFPATPRDIFAYKSSAGVKSIPQMAWWLAFRHHRMHRVSVPMLPLTVQSTTVGDIEFLKDIWIILKQRLMWEGCKWLLTRQLEPGSKFNFCFREIKIKQKLYTGLLYRCQCGFWGI